MFTVLKFHCHAVAASNKKQVMKQPTTTTKKTNYVRHYVTKSVFFSTLHLCVISNLVRAAIFTKKKNEEEEEEFSQLY